MIVLLTTHIISEKYWGPGAYMGHLKDSQEINQEINSIINIQTVVCLESTLHEHCIALA